MLAPIGLISWQYHWSGSPSINVPKYGTTSKPCKCAKITWHSAYHCAFCKLQPGTKHVAFRGRAVRPPRCPTTEERATFAAQLAALPAAPWHLDVDLHYLQQAQSLAQIGTGFCPVTPSHATQTYLTEATLQLVGQRKAYRKYLRLEEAERSRRLLMVAFAAFLLNARGQTFTEAMQTCAEAWLTQIDQSLAHALERLYELTTAVRAAVKRDRVSYLDALAGGIALHDLKDPKSLYAAVRKAFPKASSSRRMRFQPLPAVRLENGMLAPDAASRRQRWTEFFQAQEAGEQVAPEAYKQLFHRPDFPVLPDGPVFEIHALPTLLDFEQQLHAAKYGKASGPDALTAELVTTLRAGFQRHPVPSQPQSVAPGTGTLRVERRLPHQLSKARNSSL